MKLLNDQPTEHLLKAFCCLSQPEMMLRYHLEKLVTMLEETSPNVNAIKTFYRKMMSQAFETDSVLDPPLLGKAYKSIQPFKARLELESGQLDTEDHMQMADGLSTLIDEVLAACKKQKPGTMLKDYSPWLAQYKAVQWGSGVEIPGQYDGESKPILQHHVTIVGFSPTVRVT